MLPFRLRWIEGFAGTWAVSHVISVAVFLLTVVLLARVLRQRRAPASTLSWLLAIALIPYVGVPLFLLLGGRKLVPRRDKPVLHKNTTAYAAATPLERMLASAGVHAASVGNTLTLHATGNAARDALLGALANARETVRVTTFLIGDDAAGNAVLQALADAASRGVEVRLLVDGLFQWRANRKAIARVRAAGGRVVFFMPVLPLPFRARANLRNHRKLVVVDGHTAFVGGMNLADEYLGTGAGWRDIMLEVQGPAVPRIDEIFRSDWAFAAREGLEAPGASMPVPPAGTAGRVQVVPSGPDVPGDTLYDAVLMELFRAERRVWIATPYFIPDEALVRGLMLAARRGVDVTIVVPARSNHITADLAGGASLRELQAVGVHVRPWKGMLHAKAAVFDDLAVIGSANLDMRSLFLDYELSLFLTSPGDVGFVVEWFEATVAACAPKLAPAGVVRAGFETVGRLLAPVA